MGINPTEVKQPQMEYPKPEQNGYPKFILSILSDIENFAEISTVELFFKSEQNGRHFQETPYRTNENEYRQKTAFAP